MRQFPGARQTASFKRTMPELGAGTITFLFTDIAGKPSGWEGTRSAMAAAVTKHIAHLDVRTSRLSYGRVG